MRAPFLSIVLIAAAATVSAQNISRPIERPDFTNRIWTAVVDKPADSPTRLQSQLLQRPNAEDIHDYLRDCETGRPCRKKVLVAGTGYLQGWSGTKNTVELIDPASGQAQLALLHSFELHDGLTNAVLARFRRDEVVPSCVVPVQVPAAHAKYEYGSWSIHSVHRSTDGNYLAWLAGSGGDGGWQYSLQKFLAFTPACDVIRSDDYIVTSGPPEKCARALLEHPTYFSVQADGRIVVHAPKKSCVAVKLLRR